MTEQGETRTLPPTEEQSKFKQFVNENKVLVILLAIVLVAGLVVAYFVLDVKNDKAPVASIAAAEKDEVDEITCEGELVDNVCKATTVEEELNLSKEDLKNLSESIGEVYKGFEADQLDIGVGKIPKSPHERASQAFTKKTIETREELIKFFASDHKLAQAARERVVDGLENAGWPKKQIEEALTNPGRWIFIAPNVDHAIYGTTFPTKSGNGVFKVKGARGVAANDAIWYPVGNDGRIVKEAAVRADCGNPEVDKITPINPGNPPPPVTCARNCTPPPPKECEPGTEEYEERCVKKAGQNDGHSDQPVGEHPQGGTPGAGSEPNPPKPGPKPVDGNPAPDPTPGGYDSGSGNGSGTPGGSTCDGSGCTGGGPKPAEPGEPPVVDDGTHSGDPGGF